MTHVDAVAWTSPVTTHSWDVWGELYAPERWGGGSGIARDAPRRARAMMMMMMISDKD